MQWNSHDVGDVPFRITNDIQIVLVCTFNQKQRSNPQFHMQKIFLIDTTPHPVEKHHLWLLNALSMKLWEMHFTENASVETSDICDGSFSQLATFAPADTKASISLKQAACLSYWNWIINSNRIIVFHNYAACNKQMWTVVRENNWQP